MTEPHPRPIDPPQAGWLMLLLAIAVVGVVFFMAEHTLGKSALEGFAEATEDIEFAGIEGSVLRRVAFTLIALFGLFCLLLPGGRRFRLEGPLPLIMLFGFAWCLASVLWSADVSLTVQRVGVVAFCFLGLVGLGRQLSLRDLAVLALTLTAVYAAVGIAAELALGTFNPLSREFRFAGTMHPNMQGSYCAVMCLSAVCLAGRAGRGRWLLWALAVLAAGLLLMTKSRTGTASLIVALAALWALRASMGRRLFVGLVAVWAVSAAALVVVLLDIDLGNLAAEAVLMGREKDHAVSLTGRIPLWSELLAEASDRFLLGYGYGAFWTPENVAAASDVVGSGVAHAHSAYLETLLGMGLPGLAALVAVLAIGVCRSARQFVQTGQGGHAFLFALLVYAALNSTLESAFAAPTFVSFLAACGLSRLAFHPQARTADGCETCRDAAFAWWNRGLPRPELWES